MTGARPLFAPNAETSRAFALILKPSTKPEGKSPWWTKPRLKPKKPHLVEVESDPTNVFDDLAALRKESRVTVTKRELLTVVPVDKPPSDGYFESIRIQK